MTDHLSEMEARARQPVTTVSELNTLDTHEMIDGYCAGLDGEPEPGNNRSKSYWHGWRNGNADRTHTSDAAMAILAREIVKDAMLALNPQATAEGMGGGT